MAIYHPPTFINDYLIEKTIEFNSGDGIPFFPTSPTSIDDLTESFPLSSTTFCVYDRMLKMRRTPFPHIKCEQLMYYFYCKGSNAIENVINVTQAVQDLLDYEDESAEEINNWIKSKLTTVNGQKVYMKSGKAFAPVYFHRLKVYQLQETRDIIDFGTARTYAGNKIIIDYDWHKS